MSTIAEIREAIATAVGTIDGLRSSPYALDTVNPPQAMVLRRQFEYDQVQEPDHYDGMFVVRVIGGRTAERSAQIYLDGLVEPGDGVHGAIEADSTLGGVVDDCHVVRATEVEGFLIGEVEYLAVDFELEVIV